MSAIIEQITIVNNDGTPIDDFPKNPLLEKWDRLYPPTRHGHPCSSVLGYSDAGSPIMNYGCVLCSEESCRHSSCFVIPEEDKIEYEEYKAKVREYDILHGNIVF